MQPSDFGDMVDALEHARVIDLARFVARTTREDTRLKAMPFADSWNILLARYAARAVDLQHAASPDDAPLDDE